MIIWFGLLLWVMPLSIIALVVILLVKYSRFKKDANKKDVKEFISGRRNFCYLFMIPLLAFVIYCAIAFTVALGAVSAFGDSVSTSPLFDSTGNATASQTSAGAGLLFAGVTLGPIAAGLFVLISFITSMVLSISNMNLLEKNNIKKRFSDWLIVVIQLAIAIVIVAMLYNLITATY